MPPIQADEREGAQAGHPAAFGHLAFLPAAFEADQEPDGQSEAQTLKQVEGVHHLIVVSPVRKALMPRTAVTP